MDNNNIKIIHKDILPVFENRPSQLRKGYDRWQTPSIVYYQGEGRVEARLAIEFINESSGNNLRHYVDFDLLTEDDDYIIDHNNKSVQIVFEEFINEIDSPKKIEKVELKDFTNCLIQKVARKYWSWDE